MNWSEFKKREGFVILAKHYIEQNPEIVRQFLSNILIYKAEFIDFGDDIKYNGFSELFEISGRGETEQYRLIFITKEADENVSVFGRLYEKGDHFLVKIEVEKMGGKKASLLGSRLGGKAFGHGA